MEKQQQKKAELAGELTELFHTSVKMGCWNPRMAKDVEWGPRCPCCPLGCEGGRAAQRGAGWGN